MNLKTALATCAVASVLAGCGGGDPGAEPADGSARAQILKKGNDCIGSCSGGGGTPVVGAANPLPTSAPAPDILVRESFGPGPEDLRPKGGKGDMRSSFIGSTLGGFWVEWPGGKNTAWITPSGETTWKFTSIVMVTDPIGNPWEMPSPLEVGGMRGQAWSDTTDGAATGWPTALVPVALPASPWTLSIEGSPQAMYRGPLLALGVTDSGLTLNNLTTVGKATLLLRAMPDDPAGNMTWELWLGGVSRTLLASGVTEDLYHNRMAIHYDPQRKLLSASVNGVPTAAFAADLGRPRYAGFEGTGMVDNFVIRNLPVAAP